MSEKTVLVIFPSIYSLNKINDLAANVSKILRIKNQHHSGVRKNESLVIVEAIDPVLSFICSESIIWNRQDCHCKRSR